MVVPMYGGWLGVFLVVVVVVVVLRFTFVLTGGRLWRFRDNMWSARVETCLLRVGGRLGVGGTLVYLRVCYSGVSSCDGNWLMLVCLCMPCVRVLRCMCMDVFFFFYLEV